MRRKLGELLLEAGAVTPEDIDQALVDQSQGEPSRLGDLLVSLGKITPLQLALALSQQYGVPFTQVPPVPSSLVELVPLDFQRAYRFVPFKMEGTALSIAMADLSQATTDVLPRLKGSFAKVNVYVAASDEIDAVHSALAGQDASPIPQQLPQIAPVITPVTRRPRNAAPAPHPVHHPTAEELFGSLDFEEPQPPPPPPLSSDSMVDIEVAVEDGATQGYVSTPSISIEVEEPLTDAEPTSIIVDFESLHQNERADFEVDSPASVEEELAQIGATLDSEPTHDEPVPFEVPEPAWSVAAAVASEPVPEVALEAASDAAELFATGAAIGEGDTPTAQLKVGGEDDAFFDLAPRASPIPEVADDAFVPGVPFSSPSSLAQLVIEPSVPVIPAVAPVDPPPVADAQGDLPAWLQQPEGEVAGWSGALDQLPPSKLIVAVTKALLRRGLITESDVLDAAAEK